MLRPIAFLLLVEIIKLTCTRVLRDYNEYLAFIKDEV